MLTGFPAKTQRHKTVVIFDDKKKVAETFIRALF
jgi:hypothetical protein